MDLIRDLIPYTVPIALGAVTALLTPGLSTPRRLRHDLTADTEMLAHLPTEERQDLEKDIKRRARYLIAMTRWPSVTLYDLLALLALTAVGVYTVLLYIIPVADGDLSQVGDPLVLGLPALLGASCWAAFYGPWGGRAKSRLEHIRSHLGEDEAVEAAKTVRVAHYLAVLAGGLVIVGAQVALVVLISAAAEGDSWLAGGSVIGAIAGGGLMWIAWRSAQLGPVLTELSQTYRTIRADVRRGAEMREAARRARETKESPSSPPKGDGAPPQA